LSDAFSTNAAAPRQPEATPRRTAVGWRRLDRPGCQGVYWIRLKKALPGLAQWARLERPTRGLLIASLPLWAAAAWLGTRPAGLAEVPGLAWVVCGLGIGIALAWAASAARQLEARRTAERQCAALQGLVEQLRASEARLHSILDSIQDVRFRADPQRVLQAVSAAARDQTGYDPAELIGRPLADLFAQRADFERLSDAVLTQGKALEFEFLLRRKDGQGVAAMVSVTSEFETGAAAGWSGTLRTMAAQQRTEQELVCALQREREYAELKSQFVALISHEFRNPLGVILWSADMLANYWDRLDQAARERQIADILAAARQMAGLMEEVLLLGRLEAGQVTLRTDDLDLRALCQGIQDEVFTATNQRCPIHLALDGVPSTVHADEHLLRHILSNLLSNAVKYSNPGSQVDLMVDRQAHEAIFRVRDRGIGIPAADQSRLFVAFQRGQNVGHRPGTGLGLMITKHCVELHGGTIAFTSEEGAGTSFTVRLPLLRERAALESALETG